MLRPGSAVLLFLVVPVVRPEAGGLGRFLQSQGLSQDAWESLEPDQRKDLLGRYLEGLEGTGREDQAALELLRRLEDPDAMKGYVEGSLPRAARLEAAAPAVETAAGGSAPGGAPDEAARAGGLALLELIRPGAPGPPSAWPGGGGPPPGAPLAGPPRFRFPPGEPATLDDLAGRRWGKELLEGIGPDGAGTGLKARNGWTLKVEYGDLEPYRQRADSDIRPDLGVYRVVLDARLKGTEAEATTKAHEMSHIRDMIDFPEARPETMGLLMERRANLYEIGTYLERHPGIRGMPRPRNFYEVEAWFKARVFADRLAGDFPEELPRSGPLSQVRKKASDIVEACRAQPCGGTEALFSKVVDPLYARTNEGNILERHRPTLPPGLQLVWDRAEVYERETRRLEARLRAAYGLELP